MPVVDLLNPQPGERILDLGCGDGALTQKLQEMGCELVGIDASPELIEAAVQRGLNATVQNASQMTFHEEFDAVFSNAVLHWIKEADLVIGKVFRALRLGGRFVAECGGHKCVETIQTALLAELENRGYNLVLQFNHLLVKSRRFGMRLQIAGCLVCFVIATPFARAHHSTASFFFLDQRMSIEGEVVEFHARNPHGLIVLDVTNELGEVERWRAEMPAWQALYRWLGWSPEDLQPGDQIAIHGAPPRMRDSFSIRADDVEMPDGWTRHLFRDPETGKYREHTPPEER